jgi:hypothetical protein
LKIEKIHIMVGIFSAIVMIILSLLQIIIYFPQAAEVLLEILAQKQHIVENVPRGVIGEVDYGIPITPPKSLPNGSSVIMILTLGGNRQPLGFAQVFFFIDDEVYGPI